MAERAGRITPNLEVAGSTPISSKVLLTHARFFSFFNFHLKKLLFLLFWLVFANVFDEYECVYDERVFCLRSALPLRGRRTMFKIDAFTRCF